MWIGGAGVKNPNRVAAGKRVAARRIAKICRYCGSPFAGTYKQIYCARSCKERAQLAARPAHCVVCGAAIASTRRPKLYCSAKCKRGAKLPRNFHCRFCGKPFPRRGRRVYCSEACRTRQESVERYVRNTGGALQQFMVIQERTK